MVTPDRLKVAGGTSSWGVREYGSTGVRGDLEMAAPKLSVVVPTYNHAHYLPRALDAILGQSLQPREVIIVDDASTDGSQRLIEDYARKHPAIRAVRNERNLGVVASLNRGAELSSGEYLVFAASDDYILPGFYEKSIALLERFPQAGLSTAFDS